MINKFSDLSEEGLLLKSVTSPLSDIERNTYKHQNIGLTYVTL